MAGKAKGTTKTQIAKQKADRPKKDGGGKQKKKKWSKGKVREKLNNLILFEGSTYDKMKTEAVAYKCITPSSLSERLKIRGSLARAMIHQLHEDGLIQPVVKHSRQLVYKRSSTE
ncbi:hypothetical protein SNEBB_002500 [Seison nebaliae]|nr:hypothetical protein SNEBB_002500 [Seison nebaliae]